MDTPCFHQVMFGLVTAIAAVTASSGCSNKEAMERDTAKLQGVWVPEPNESAYDAAFRTGFVNIKDDTFSMETVGFWWKAKYSLAPSTDPKRIDFTRLGGDIGFKQGIYSVDGDTLKICFSSLGKDRPNKFESLIGGSLCVTYRRKVDPR